MVNRVKKNIYELAGRIANGIRDQFPQQKSENERLIQEIKRALNSQLNISPEWSQYQHKVLKEFQQKSPSDFLNFQNIRETMFFSPPVIEFSQLKNSEGWKIYRNGIRENFFGNPKRYIEYPSSSGNLIHHAYSLLQLQKVVPLEKIVKSKQIFEFGGGYGSFRRLVHQIGFKGDYVIYDLPMFCLIQKFFLANATNGQCKTTFISKTDDLHTIDKPDIFVALWSFSETPLALRTSFENIISKTHFILIAFQNDFSGADNLSYFKQLLETQIIKEGQIIEIDHIPSNYYLIGSNPV
jgi:hypothetical protein